jgi:hypothetical protein
MSHNNLNRRHFKPLLRRGSVSAIRPYDLRHTFAALWIESGKHPKILQEPLSYSRIFLDTYSRVVLRMQAASIQRFGARFSAPFGTLQRYGRIRPVAVAERVETTGSCFSANRPFLKRAWKDSNLRHRV